MPIIFRVSLNIRISDYNYLGEKVLRIPKNQVAIYEEKM